MWLSLTRDLLAINTLSEQGHHAAHVFRLYVHGGG